MKNFYNPVLVASKQPLFFLLAFLIPTTTIQAQNVGIGTASPASSAVLDITASNKGMLIPRMTASQRSGITAPAMGLQVYQTDGTAGFYYFDGTNWRGVSSGEVVGSTGSLAMWGVTSTFAGSGALGDNDATSTAATFSSPAGLAIDAAGNIYVADAGNNKIRKITPAGVVTTVAGNGSAGNKDGSGAGAFFSNPTGLDVDAAGNIYVADAGNNSIRKISAAGVVTTLAGSGSTGSNDGTGTAASFYKPLDVAVDASGNVFVADYVNSLIRKITPSGVVSTVAVNTTIRLPSAIDIDAAGNLYVTGVNLSSIYKISTAGIVTKLAGNGLQGSADGTGSAASFIQPLGITIDTDGNLYIADFTNNNIRKVTPANVVTTIAGTGSLGKANGLNASATFNNPTGIVIDASGNIYVGDYSNNLIRKITPPTTATNVVVDNSSVQIISGQKNFTESVIIGNPTTASTLTVNGGGGDALLIRNGGDTRIFSSNNNAGGSALFYATGGTAANNATFTVVSEGNTFSFNGSGISITSDKRMKKNIAPLQGSLRKIMQLHGYSYHYKWDTENHTRQVGVLAQEVKKVLPEAVHTDEKGIYSVSYTALVPLLINGMKEQQEQIKVAKKENEALRKRLDAIEATLKSGKR